jgi:ribosomal-protein-alanine N-acetyltransferase
MEQKWGRVDFRWNVEESHTEVGYDLKKEFLGNGYMYEALNEIINFAKTNMKINRIDA